MSGYIKDRTIKKGIDKNGKTKENLKVYDVYFRYKDPTTGEWKKTSKKGFRTKKEAENYLIEINSQILHNKFVQPKKLTVREYLTAWLNTYVEVNLRKTSIDGYRRNIEKHIIPALGNIELQNLTVNHIDEFYANKQRSGRLDGKGGLSAKTLQYIHRVFSEAIEHAVKKNLMPRNIIKDATNKPRPKKYKNDIYNSLELIDLLAVTKGTYMEVAIALGGIYGLRRGEVLGLKWSNVDFESETINISQQLIPINKKLEFCDTKSEESNRMLPMTKEMKEILERRKFYLAQQYKKMSGTFQDNDMVVCNDDGTLINPSWFSKRFSNVLKSNNMKHIRFHDLRHTCATLMLSSGVDLKVTSTWLGHSSISITSDTYVKVMTDVKKQAAEKMSNSIFNQSKTDDK